MEELVNVLLAIDKACTVLQKALDCRPGLGGLNQVYGPHHPTSLCSEYLWYILTRCLETSMFLFDIFS